MRRMDFPIYVINMASSHERLADVTKQLQRFELDFERIDAVVGADLSETEIAQVYDVEKNKSQYHRRMTVGEIGCYLSYRRAFKQLIDSGHDYALILEDDLDIQNNFLSALEVVSRSSGWDLLKLSDTQGVDPAQSKSIDDSFSLVSYKKVPNRAMAYFISRAAAEKMLALDKFFRPVDIDFQCYRDFGISVCGLTPNSVEMSPEFGFPEQSDIAKANKGRHSGRSTFWGNLKYRLDMFLRRQHRSYNVEEFVIKGE